MSRNTPGWASGKAFEYLVVRAFELDGCAVRWPYQSLIGNEVVEQIDGAVVANGLHCLVECKDEKQPQAIAPLAKMRNQLLRRPPATVGLIFSTSNYTAPAQTLASFLGGQTILLWYREEIQTALTHQKIVPALMAKYRACVETGVYDANAITLGVWS